MNLHHRGIGLPRTGTCPKGEAQQAIEILHDRGPQARAGCLLQLEACGRVGRVAQNAVCEAPTTGMSYNGAIPAPIRGRRPKDRAAR